MQTIGLPSLSLELVRGIEGECTLCPADLLPFDESYVFTDGEEALIAALHKDCFRHMAAVMRKHIEEFGLPKQENAN